MAEIFDLIIKGGDVWTREGLRQIDIAINSGKIQMLDNINVASGQNIFQASTLGWIRRLSISLIIVFGFFIWLIHSLLPSYLSISYGIGSPKNAVKMEKNVKFLTSDGISLVTNIYHPIRVGDVPTILVRVPYTRTFSNSYKADLVGRIWSEQGYTVEIGRAHV